MFFSQAIDDLECLECESDGTVIGEALKFAREKVLTESCGDRKDVDDVVILISDGESTEGNKTVCLFI